MRNFVIGPLPPPLGGVSVAVINLIRVLESNGTKPEVFNTSSHSIREDIYKKKELRSYFRNLLLFPKFLTQVVSGGKRTDIFHVFTTSDTAFFRDAFFITLLTLLRRTVVVHFHSKTKGEFFLHPWRLRFLGSILSRASRVFVLSQIHFDFFGRYIDRKKLAILENFVHSKDFEVGQDNPPNRMLYVSRLSEMKGTWELLQAIRKFHQSDPSAGLRVTIAGLADTEENEAKMRSFIVDHGLIDIVQTPGLVQNSAKKKLFKENGVFIFPSRFENSPVTLKEATQAGMVIIASDIDANLNILKRCDNALTFPVGDSDALAVAMNQVIEDPDLYARLKANSINSEKFDEFYAADVLSDYL